MWFPPNKDSDILSLRILGILKWSQPRARRCQALCPLHIAILTGSQAQGGSRLGHDSTGVSIMLAETVLARSSS